MAVVGLLGVAVRAEPVAEPLAQPAAPMPPEARTIRAAECTPSSTSTDTTARLGRLRELMAASGVTAYVIPSDDEHGVSRHARCSHAAWSQCRDS